MRIARFFVLSVLVLGISLRAAGAEKLSVLLVVSDDLCTHLGTYGDPVVKSPNLDRLAARGVKFEHAYCQYALCNPSRASFLTGLRPDNTGVHDNSVYFRDKVPNAQTLGQTFQKAGYFVARVGKLYHYGVPAQIGTNGLDDPPSWNERINPKGRDVDDFTMIEKITSDKNGKAHWEKATGLNQLGATLSRLAADGPDEDQTDGKSATAAIKLMREPRNNPFFLAVGFYRPHTPYVAPKKYFDMYPLDSIQLPTVPAGYRDTVPAIALHTKPVEEAMTDTQRKEAIQAYYAATTFMDAQLGRLLDAMDQMRVTDKTIIVFISDHGYHLYEHGLWQKQTLFENGTRVPMVIAVPGKSAGKTCTRPVELVDLHPTLADLAGLPIPEKLDGYSLRSLIENPEAEWSHPAFSQLNRGPKSHAYSMRTEKFRYTEWGSGENGVELYDEENDPKELKNLAKDPAQKENIAKLSAMLRAANPKAGK